jgi:hypothetical protein
LEPVAPGIEEMNNLQQAGFSDQEIVQWRTDTSRDLQDAGFSTAETDAYFGEKTPDLSKTEANFKSNIQAKAAAKAETQASPEPQSLTPKLEEADSFIEAIEAGFDMSVTGLMQKRPDMVIAENAPMFYRIASQVGTLAGDVPAMIAGAFVGAPAGAAVGSAIGSAVPVAGTVAGAAAGAVVGAGAGAFALPEGIRTALMEHYDKGDVKSFSDFWERASAVAINSLKAGVVGGATAGVGGVVGKIAAPAIIKTTAQLTAEVATMTTVGAALEGKVPEPHEFLDAAILVGGLRGATHVAGKARNMYSKKGISPVELAEKAHQDAHLKQQVLSENVEIPSGGELGITIPKQKPPENFETSKPFKEPKNEYSQDVNTILSKVGEKGEKAKEKLTTSKMYTALVDKLDPINEVTKLLTENKTDLLAENNPYILARTAVDYKAKAKHFFEKGTIEFAGKKINGESLKSTLESIESPEVLDAYMISKRVVEKSNQGLTTGFDVEAAKKVVTEHGKQYEVAAKKVTEFSNRVLDYVKEAGILSNEQLVRMKESNKDYVPFKRIMDESGKVGAKKGGGKAGSLKEFKGSERDIQSPITSVVENTVELLRMAEINRPKQVLVELAEKSTGQEIIKKVKSAAQEIEVSREEVARQLGISVESADAVSTWRAVNKELAPNQFSVYKDGKRSVYETTPELAKAISKLGGDSTANNLLFKIMSGITTVKKIGITFTPDFIARNLFRDTLTASAFSKGKPLTAVDIVGAMGDIWKKNDVYYEWLKSGGANGAFLDMSKRYIETDIRGLQRETNFMNSVRNLVEKPVDVMRVAAELSEQGVRLAEFKKVRKAGGSLDAAGFASREITIDFQRVGAKMSFLNSITAFQNVSIQGLDRSVRAIKEDPSGVGIRAFTYITMPSVLLWWANKDDPRYQEIPRWEKDLFWIIPTDKWTDASPEEAESLPEYMVRQTNGKTQINKGSIYRLPKPQELGIVFGSLPERTLEAFFTENPNAFKDFNETMVNLVTPSFIPDAVAPAVEQYFNKSFFTGRDIVPNHLKDILPEYQFVEYTSETAKTLGKMVATIDKTSDFASPMVLQNYIQSWGGSLGQYAVQLADKALVATGVAPDNVDPTASLSDVPFVKSFVVRFPQAGSNSVQDFYDNYGESQTVIKTIRHLAKEGDFASVEKEMALQENQENLVSLDGIKEALTAQSKFIRLVHKNPEITADEKRQMIDGIYLMMTETAKQGNLLMQDVKKSLGE